MARRRRCLPPAPRPLPDETSSAWELLASAGTRGFAEQQLQIARLGAPILRRRFDARAQLCRCVTRPARVVEHAASYRDQIRLTARDDLVALPGLRDQPDGNRVDSRGLLD